MRTFLRGRLGALLVMLLSLTIVVGAAGWWYTRALAADLQRLYNEHLQGSVHLADAERGLWELRFALPNYQLGEVESRSAIIASSGPRIQKVNDSMSAYGALAISPTEHDLLKRWDEAFNRYLRARPQYFALIDAGKIEEAKEHRSRETNPAAAEAVGVLGSLIEAQLKLGKQHTVNAEAQALLASRVMTALLVLSIVLGGLLSRSLADDVRKALQGVQRSSSDLQSTATQQVSSSRELSTATAEISVTVRELLTTARQISDSSRSVATTAEETGASAKSGDALVKRAQEALGTMRQKVDETVRHMLNLGKKSQQIGGILELINEFAEQTNILSINARIEAAGAHDSGRRFAVVADEIRRLADRVGASAREIRGLIDEIRAAANTSVMATEDGSKAVELGARQFDEVLRTFQHISERINDTSVAARQIELSTKQQVSAVEQVNVAMVDIARSAKETETGSQYTLHTCERLAEISRQLARLSGAPDDKAKEDASSPSVRPKKGSDA